MARNNPVRSLRRKNSKRPMRARPELPSPGRLMISRCGRVARAKGLPTTITPEEIRGAA